MIKFICNQNPIVIWEHEKRTKMYWHEHRDVMWAVPCRAGLHASPDFFKNFFSQFFFQIFFFRKKDNFFLHCRLIAFTLQNYIQLFENSFIT